MPVAIPPGVFDIIPHDSKDSWKSSYLWNHVENIMRKQAKLYGFEELRTPLFERTELFQRGVGESSDIVSKEMYTFEDKGGRLLSLRPEGTAPAMRAFIEHQMAQAAPINKFFYIAPMFRYERSQAGRYRQHHQFGIEAIGISTPDIEAEIIDLLYSLFDQLGLKQLSVTLNSVGDIPSRLAYREALQNYLQQHYANLSPDSQTRFTVNPLRILDSKDEGDQKIVANAPSILDFLSEEARDHFEQLQILLKVLKIPFHINNKLVRGLDYYNKTVFEIVSGDLGAQNSLVGGGRYDGLLKTLEGPDLPAVGFGCGIERVLQTLLKQQCPLPKRPSPTLFVISLGKKSVPACLELTREARLAGISAQMDATHRKIGKIFQYCDLIGAKYVVVIGENELQSGDVELKEMETGNKIKIALSKVVEQLKEGSRDA